MIILCRRKKLRLFLSRRVLFATWFRSHCILPRDEIWHALRIPLLKSAKCRRACVGSEGNIKWQQDGEGKASALWIGLESLLALGPSGTGLRVTCRTDWSFLAPYQRRKAESGGGRECSSCRRCR